MKGVIHMNPSGDAADQVLRLTLQGTEFAIKLAGTGAKNLAAILLSMAKGEKQIKGAARLVKLLRSGEELSIIRISQDDLKEFKKLSNKYGVMYSAVRDTRATDGMCDVFFKKKDAAKVEHVMGKMDMTSMNHDREPEPIFNNPEKEFETVIDENGEPQLKKEPQQRSDSSMPNAKSQTKSGKADIPKAIKDIKAGKVESLTAANWKIFLAINASMYLYSQSNRDRIFEQAPNASVVMSKTKWRELGRYPQRGAKGINITIPEMKDSKRTGNYIDGKVYDISETYGRNNPQYSVVLKENSQEIKSEIERLKSSAPVPVEINDNIATDSHYSSEDKKIYLRSDISQNEQYIGLIKETQYANAHATQGVSYDRANNIFLAESVAYSMAAKYGLDTQEFRFDCIPDAINGLDGKDVSELINPASIASHNEIKKAEKHLDKFKSKDKPSVTVDLKANKKAIDNGSYKAKPIPFPTKPKGHDR